MDIRPLSARSLLASILLGSDPPALPGRVLVAIGEHFGLNGGTVRVALTRMVNKGELANHDGIYQIDGPLQARRERQSLSRRADTTAAWTGAWEQCIVLPASETGGRSAADRAQLRRHLGALGLGELREGVWMRPANLDPSRLPSVRAAVAPAVAAMTVAPMPPDLARHILPAIFDLDSWAKTANQLMAAMVDEPSAAASLSLSRSKALARAFSLASVSVRHLLYDPQIPDELAPADWPAKNLRATYLDFEAELRERLKDLFAEIG